MSWHLTEIAPQRYAAVYFIYLPVSNKCLYSEELSDFLAPMVYLGDVGGLSALKENHPLIPIDPHFALSLDWIELDKMIDEMPYVTDSLKACLKLIKDIKEEEHGDDKEGLSDSS